MRHSWKWLVVVLSALVYTPQPAYGNTIVLTPGSVLRIQFTSTPFCLSVCNVLNLSLVLASPAPTGTLVTTSLYSGTTLLGTNTNDPVTAGEYSSASSGYGLGTVINFTALQSSFNGYFDVTSTQTISINSTATNVDLGTETAPSQFSFNPAATQITTVQLVPPPGASNTIHVPADKATIQAAILSASNGDTVLVSPGLYHERIDFSGKAITVQSSAGPDVTTIDGGQAGPVVSFVTKETTGSVLQGFTLQNGNGALGGQDAGGGIWVSRATPRIVGNRIVNNTGGGIGVNFGAPVIQNNVISGNTNNSGALGGGGILFGGDGGGGQVLNNTITGNTTNTDGGGVVLWAGGGVTLRDNIITGNTAGGSGGGIATVNLAPAVIVDNLIAGNRAGGAGGVSFSNPPLSFINNTIAGNQSTSTAASAISGMTTSFNAQLRMVGNLIIAAPGQLALGCGTFGSSPITGTFADNDVFAPGGTAYNTNCVSQTGANGNISADPLFLSASGGNYRLQPTSPALNAGDATAAELGTTDLDGNPRLRSGRVDLGAYEYPGLTTLTLSGSSLVFNQRPVGTSSSIESVTINNAGGVALQIVSIATTGDYSQTNNCPSGAGLAPGASCVVAVTFTPTNRGARPGTLTMVSNTFGSPNVIQLNGTAVGAVINLSPTTLSFPNQPVNTDGAPLTVTVSNNGDYPLTVSGVVASTEFSQTNTCNASVASGASCTISVLFHPLASGTRTGTLTISSNAVGGAAVVQLAGNGQADVPIVSALSPNNASTGGAGFTLGVQGGNFILNSVVRWNGSDRPTTFVSTTQLSAAIPASDLANGALIPITVYNPAPGGGSSDPVILTVNNRVPAVIVISPSSALVGGPNFQLTVNGTGFVPGSVVRWNGNDRNTTFVSAGQVRADISAADISFASTNQVTVFNPAPGGGLSGSVTFTSLVPTPLPAISSISPASATAGDPALTLTVNGSGFVAGSVVQWNRAARTTTFVSDSQLQAAIAATDLAYGGTPSVTVFNPPPGGGTSASAVFTVAGNPLPVISSVTPSSLVGGGSGVTLTVNGVGFTTASVVQWNGNNRTTSYVSANQLTATLLASDTAAAAAAKVTVFSPPPGGGTSPAFSVIISANPAPVISNLLPASLVVGTAGQAVQIRGTGFTTTSAVRWNGQDRQTTVVDPFTLSILLTTADLATPGLAEVRVFNPPLGGGSSAPVWFATTVGVAANGLVYDPTRKVLWASVGSSQPKLGNSVVSIDPATGNVGSPIFVGSEPGKVVISDDGQYLYVALTATAAVRRVDLAAQTADLQFPIGSDGFFGAMYVEDMAVMPGNPHTLAISRMYKSVSPRHAGVGIYDDGVIRKNVTQTHTGSNRIEFSSSPSTIYGYNNETTEFGFRILSVDANGVTETKVYGSSPLGGFGADIKYSAGKIYATSGAILNPDTGTLIGQFSFPSNNGVPSAADGLAPDANLGRSFFFTVPFGGLGASIMAFDNSTFTPIGSLSVPALTAVSPGDDVLVRWGENGLAVRAGGQVYVFALAGVQPPAFNAGWLVTSGSYAAGPVAPGSLVSLFGNNLTPLTLGATAVPLPTSLGGISVMMNGSAVPLLYASPGQINFQVPWELAGKPSAQLSVGATGFTEKSVTINLASVSPAIFTLGAPDGQAAAVISSNGAVAAPVGFLPGSTPVQRGDFLLLYCNGMGAVNNQPLTGFAGPRDASATTILNPTVTIGGVSANVLYSGLAPGYAGVNQVNIQVPDNAPTGDAVPIVLSIGGALSNTATVAVQ